MVIPMLLAGALIAGSFPDPAGPVQPPPPLAPYPHPLITEVLYAVPTGAAGDANGDGVRDAVGDEFVELINPHDRPIQLRGYTITDRQQTSSRDGKTFTSVRFTFPALELQPGEVVVVFNGHRQQWAGPLGDSARAAAGNPRFAGARVFTMNNASARAGFANAADCIILWSPRNEPLHAICWGGAEAPLGTGVVEQAPAIKDQSVTRASATGPMQAHPTVRGKAFSPGSFPAQAVR